MFNTHRTYTLSTGVKNNSIAVFNDLRTVRVLYHRTVVFEKTPKTVTIRDGGWDTVSTRLVINRALENSGLGFRLYRIKGKTYINDQDTENLFTGTKRIKL